MYKQHSQLGGETVCTPPRKHFQPPLGHLGLSSQLKNALPALSNPADTFAVQTADICFRAPDAVGYVVPNCSRLHTTVSLLLLVQVHKLNDASYKAICLFKLQFDLLVVCQPLKFKHH